MARVSSDEPILTLESHLLGNDETRERAYVRHVSCICVSHRLISQLSSLYLVTGTARSREDMRLGSLVEILSSTRGFRRNPPTSLFVLSRVDETRICMRQILDGQSPRLCAN